MKVWPLKRNFYSRFSRPFKALKTRLSKRTSSRTTNSISRLFTKYYKVYPSLFRENRWKACRSWDWWKPVCWISKTWLSCRPMRESYRKADTPRHSSPTTCGWDSDYPPRNTWMPSSPTTFTACYNGLKTSNYCTRMSRKAWVAARWVVSFTR